MTNHMVKLVTPILVSVCIHCTTRAGHFRIPHDANGLATAQFIRDPLLPRLLRHPKPQTPASRPPGNEGLWGTLAILRLLLRAKEHRPRTDAVRPGGRDEPQGGPDDDPGPGRRPGGRPGHGLSARPVPTATGRPSRGGVKTHGGCRPRQADVIHTGIGTKPCDKCISAGGHFVHRDIMYIMYNTLTLPLLLSAAPWHNHRPHPKSV